MQLRSESSTRTVPVPDHKELKTGTLLSIIRQSQLPRSLFESVEPPQLPFKRYRDSLLLQRRARSLRGQAFECRRNQLAALSQAPLRTLQPYAIRRRGIDACFICGDTIIAIEELGAPSPDDLRDSGPGSGVSTWFKCSMDA